MTLGALFAAPLFRRLTIVTMLGLALSSTAACGPQKGLTVAPGVEAPASLSSPAELALGLNALAAMVPGSEGRDELLSSLERSLVEMGLEGLKERHYEDAMYALEKIASLRRPMELAQPQERPAVAKFARGLYDAAGRQGAEGEALFALALLQWHGSPETQVWCQQEYERLASWIDEGREFGRGPQDLVDLESLLERSAAVFPSPWLSEQLSALYLARYEKAQQSTNLFARDPRAAYAGYLLARVYLRADQPEKAVDALELVDADNPTRTLQQMLRDALDRPEQSQNWRDLVAYFEPSAEESLPLEVIVQGWGIVENLARHGLEAEPGDALLRAALGRVSRQRGLLHEAARHYEVSRKAEPGQYQIWSELAEVYYSLLEIEASEDPERAVAQLEQLEQYHRTAAQRWSDRPLAPGLGQAYLMLAGAFFDSGRPARASELLQRSLDLEPGPIALELLGTIAMRAGKDADAQGHYEDILQLPFPDQHTRLSWEIRARLALAELSLHNAEQDGPDAAQAHLQGALKQLNTFLGTATIAPEERALHLSTRAVVLFKLGELELATRDFEGAASLIPDHPGVYADLLLPAVTHGHAQLAQLVYSRAMSRESIDPELRLYFSLWMADLQPRSGAAPDRRIDDYLREYPGEDWAKSLARHSLGELSYEELLSDADTPGRKAEAHFYEGLRQARDGKARAALKLMEAVLETGMMGFFEYEMAQQYLVWGEVPAKPRAALETAGS